MKVKVNMCFIISIENFYKKNNSIGRKVESMEKSYKFKLQEDIKVRNEAFQKKKITFNIISTYFVDILEYIYFLRSTTFTFLRSITLCLIFCNLHFEFYTISDYKNKIIQSYKCKSM